MPKIIYLDNHATTPVDPRVLRAMLPYFREKFGNAASATHALGREAKSAVENARGKVARLIHAQAREIVFTSGATESNNLALKGAALAYREKGNHLITVATEHKSVLDCFKRLKMEGFQVTVLPVQSDGILDLNELKKSITARTILISVMMANNEIGVIQPIAEIGKIAKEKDILFHCDAAQAVGKIPVNVSSLSVDLLSFNAHKIYGPKGVGALFVRKSGPVPRIIPLLDGGGHEVGLRSGTLNVPGIVGFGEACGICAKEMTKESKRLKKLRDRLCGGFLEAFPDAVVIGSLTQRLSNNLNISFPGVLADQLIKSLGSIAVSSGSACLSTSPEPSYVLTALGLRDAVKRSSIRFGLGRFNTQKEVDLVIKKVLQAVNGLVVK
jgi:cysteine desulfurase